MDKRSIENITHHADVSEKAIERYLVEQAKINGLLCLKYSNPNMVGYPDRLLVIDNKPDIDELIKLAKQ